MSSSKPTSNVDDRFAIPLDMLRQFAHQREIRPPAELCELCSVEIPAKHRHLLELSKRTLICVCHPCSILFGDPVAGAGKYRLVPSRYLLLSDFSMTDEQWDDLMLPVNMVSIFYNTNTRRVTAFYPSPAGAMESLLPLEGWDTLVNNNPILHELESDVEALLINRVQNRGGHSYREHYIVPIDTCYELVGLIRLKWKGLSGGEEVWKAIAEYFTALRLRATPIEQSTDVSRTGKQSDVNPAHNPYAGERRA
ncbi:DUF5947 family protein [Dictyobacter arantiisoli]|uniref:Uncharacterized protein n=1 Tax=Dictyobacter arantiisoli TaxID=2014874 RepID=A0A5A5TF48_9CHLR|nr:DUF5947 family protein [Dictyobacter arantiisoli]GCF09967.1 hypothetical protein KDI_35310 [Dictyobacter arantiisoli]